LRSSRTMPWLGCGDRSRKLRPLLRGVFSSSVIAGFVAVLVERRRDPAAKAAGIRDLPRWSAGGRLRHPAPTILPLSEIARAHELVESHSVIGKVMLAL
jgi:NADPH:quinone reductase-like Zn-dependent oxidoreductase